MTGQTFLAVVFMLDSPRMDGVVRWQTVGVPTSLPVITAIYYLIRCQAKIIFTLQPFFRINITLITSLLTAKTVLMIAFMINFNLMTSEFSNEPKK